MSGEEIWMNNNELCFSLSISVEINEGDWENEDDALSSVKTPEVLNKF